MPEYSYQIITDPSQLADVVTIKASYEEHTFGYSNDEIEMYKRQLMEPHAFQAIAWSEQSKPVGYIAASESLFPGNLFISELLIDQKAQGHGLGTLLVNEAISFARAQKLAGVYTETEVWNLPAQALYEKCAFIKVDNPSWTGGPTYRLSF